MPITKESIRQPFWAMGVEETLSALESGIEGISNEETKKRLKIFGPNTIKEERRLAKIRIFLNQLRSPLILVLIAAGAITIFLQEWISAAVIFAAVLVNSSLGFWQENKTEKVLSLLKSYIRVRSRVKRNGAESELDASELVPGDVIKITQGNRVPADARLIFAKNLEIDEAILTGESLPIVKDVSALAAATSLPERKSIVFSGTLAARGLAEAVIVATGGETEFGRIAKLAGEKEKEQTPLQRAITDFTIRAGVILGALVLFLFGLGIYYGKDIYEMFLIAVAVAVSAVPEGLPIALTVILAIGVERLSHKKGIVRKLLAAETLGSTTIILTDKTGTLTEAKMEIHKILPHGSMSENKLMEDALLNTDPFGSPVEIAVIKGAKQAGVLMPQVEILDKFPFNQELKFAAAIYKKDSRKATTLMGAPEMIADRTNLDATEKKKILSEVESLAYAGNRILAVASGAGEKFENLSFLGIIALKDPLRPAVKKAVEHIAALGVKTVIVTGDHKGTAESVAIDLGMIDGKGAVLTSEDMAHLSPEELKNRADNISVFARASPKDKITLVNVFKEKGEVVAVTGDGINDAPALKAADIGVAVGSGTDVAKSAADLIILDDNFETIVAAIEEGRRILGNIKKVIVYLLSDSLDELFLIGGSLALGITLPLNALQILFVNFFSDSFPALALAFEKTNENHGQPSSNKKNGIFDKEVKFLILVIGVLTSALLFAMYYYLLKLEFDENFTRTFIFASFATYTLFLAFSVRDLKKSLIEYNPFSNLSLTLGVGTGLLLTLLVIYFPPLQNIFDTAPLPLPWLLGVIAVGILNIVAVELSKWLFRKKIL